MKRQWSFCGIVLLLVSSVHAFNVLMDGYTLEDYAHYSSTTSSDRMEFDDVGNLYINHYNDGKIQRINTSGQVSTLVSGLSGLYDMTWGGGTNYGNYLYVSSRSQLNDKILRIDLNGNTSTFSYMSSPYHAADSVAIDRTGNYNGYLYSGTSGLDKLVTINSTGNVSLFSSWPGQTSGGVYGIGFDTTGYYNGKMYIATMFGSADADKSGLFLANPNGTISRFSSNLASVLMVDIDPVGTYFDNNMFVMGRTNFTDPLSLWRVSTSGVAEEFMRNVRSFTFGDDGAMYVSYYNWGTQDVSIARVVPEPATLILLAAGGLFLKRRHI